MTACGLLSKQGGKASQGKTLYLLRLAEAAIALLVSVPVSPPGKPLLTPVRDKPTKVWLSTVMHVHVIYASNISNKLGV
jgi:hypothetical protein